MIRQLEVDVGLTAECDWDMVTHWLPIEARVQFKLRTVRYS